MVWSRRQPLASVGAVLSLLDGPTGCDPAFCIVWFRFRLFVVIFLVLLLVLMISLSGLTLLVFWLSGFLFLFLCIGLLVYVELLILYELWAGEVSP